MAFRIVFENLMLFHITLDMREGTTPS